MHDAPAGRPDLAGVLLAALARSTPSGAVTLAMVDPAVGAERAGLVAHAGSRWYVGPDNGLLAPLLREPGARVWRLVQSAAGSAHPGFHGRDLHAPAASAVALGRIPEGAQRCGDWQGSEQARGVVIYADGFGNLFTGLAGSAVPVTAALRVGGRSIGHQSTLSAAKPGQACWFENTLGLVEVAVNRGSAAEQLRVRPGDDVEVVA